MALKVETQQGKRQKSMEDLNDDLVYEILCRIPYKNLMQCKCVCQRWLLLISNPNPNVVAGRRLLSMKKVQSWTFMYLSNKTNKVKFSSKDPVFRSPGFSLSFLPCYEPNKTKPIHILRTFHDLVLCCENEIYQTVYYVCNPLTMQWVALPRIPGSRRFLLPSVHFTCELYKDPKQHEGVAMCRFKVVRVHMSKGTRIIRVEIFSSETETGRWIRSSEVLLPNEPILTVILNDSLFVLAKVHKREMVMILFSLNSLINNDHHYQTVQLPKEERFGYSTVTPVVYQGRLRLVRLIISNETPILYIWELKEDYSIKGDEWNLVHRVSFTEIVTDSEWFSEVIVKTRVPPRDQEHELLQFLNFHPVDGNVVYFWLHGRMASYDMWNKSLSFRPETRLCKSFTGKKRFLRLVLPLRPTTIPKV